MGTVSATIVSYESYVETVCTFAQTIDHANRKAATKNYIIRPYKPSPIEDKVDKTLNMADVVMAMGTILVGGVNLVSQVHTVAVTTTTGYHMKNSII